MVSTIALSISNRRNAVQPKPTQPSARSPPPDPAAAPRHARRGGVAYVGRGACTSHRAEPDEWNGPVGDEQDEAMSEYALENLQASPPSSGIPRLHQEFKDAEARIMLLPPGRVDIRTKVDRPLNDVNINQVSHQIAINDDRRRPQLARAEAVGFFPRDAEISLETTNVLPAA